MNVDLRENHFALFGLPVQYRIDRAALEAAYGELQRVVHPDRFAGASDQERRISMQQAAHVNEAYRVLKDPLARAGYLLELRGFDASQAAGQTRQDPAFLMQQMELREALAEVPQAEDPFAALQALVQDIEHSLRSIEQELEAMFTANHPDNLARAADAVQRMQFYRKLEEEAAELETELEDRLDGL